MKKFMIMCIAILVLLSACTNEILEPEQCSLCAGLPHHAPCIINLSTGEMLELAVYEPHPFIAGELAEDQQGGTFSFVRGAGVEGYKLGGESLTIRIPMESEGLNLQFFCKGCRKRLAAYTDQGYVVVDLKEPENPIIYEVYANASFFFRCYDISVHKQKEEGKTVIVVVGTLAYS